MAKRYSGDISGTVTYRDPKFGSRNRNGDYKVTLSSRSGGKKTIIVGAPAFLSEAVDSSAAYDDTFRAAVAFAEDEGWSAQPDYKRDGSGIRVTRTKR